MKPKAVSLGFTEIELQGVAARIADNLGSQDATDEEIDAQIDAVMPFLSLGQTMATRVINKTKPIKPVETETTQVEKSGSQTPPNTDDEPSWFKVYRETQEKRIAAIENEKVGATRRSELEAIAKDAGALGAKILKDFSRMNFESDEAFATYLEETKADAEAFKQEVADKGLSGMGKPAAGGVPPKTDINSVVKERIAERQAETVAPAIVGLPQTK